MISVAVGVMYRQYPAPQRQGLSAHRPSGLMYVVGVCPEFKKGQEQRRGKRKTKRETDAYIKDTRAQGRGSF